MGWCGGTDIMDAAVEGAEAAVRAVLEEFAPPGSDEAVREKVDEVLRPFVRRIARKLHEGDWDCVDEADAFDRFPQEMYDHDDRQHEAWIRDRLADATRYDEPEQVLRWSGMLKAHTDKMKAGNS